MMTDYEVALRNSVRKKAFSATAISVCFFHFGQLSPVVAELVMEDIV